MRKLSLLYLTLVVLFSSLFQPVIAQNFPDEKLSSKDKQSIIEQFAIVLKENYLYPDSAILMGQLLENQMNKGAYDDIKTARKFTSRITKDLRANFQDRHIGIKYAPKLVKTMNDGTSNTPVSEEEIERLLAIEVYENFRIPKVQRINGNIGYIKIDEMLPPEYARGYTEKVAAAFELIADTEAIILDLRDNPGGYVEGVDLIISYFFEANTLISHGISRVNGSHVKNEGRTIEVSGRQVLSQPVYVLVSGRTGSGAEAIAHTLQHSKRGVIIGQQTYGAGYAFDEYAVADKYVAQVPYASSMHPNANSNWESVGVTPTYKVAQLSELDFARRIAIKEMLEKEQAKPKNEQYQYRVDALQWESDRLNDLSQAFELSSDQIGELVGSYGNRVISSIGEDLYYHRLNPERPKRKLIPVKADEFLIEGLDQYRISFNRDKKTNEIVALRLFTSNRLFIDKKQK